VHRFVDTLFTASNAASTSAIFPAVGAASVIISGWPSDRLGIGGRSAVMFFWPSVNRIGVARSDFTSRWRLRFKNSAGVDRSDRVLPSWPLLLFGRSVCSGFWRQTRRSRFVGINRRRGFWGGCAGWRERCAAFDARVTGIARNIKPLAIALIVLQHLRSCFYSVWRHTVKSSQLIDSSTASFGARRADGALQFLEFLDFMLGLRSLTLSSI
jgi:hypothetical protein